MRDQMIQAASADVAGIRERRHQWQKKNFGTSSAKEHEFWMRYYDREEAKAVARLERYLELVLGNDDASAAGSSTPPPASSTGSTTHIF